MGRLLSDIDTPTLAQKAVAVLIVLILFGLVLALVFACGEPPLAAPVPQQRGVFDRIELRVLQALDDIDDGEGEGEGVVNELVVYCNKQGETLRAWLFHWHLVQQDDAPWKGTWLCLLEADLNEHVVRHREPFQDFLGGPVQCGACHVEAR
mgnify:FL=1